MQAAAATAIPPLKGGCMMLQKVASMIVAADKTVIWKGLPAGAIQEVAKLPEDILVWLTKRIGAPM